MGLVDIYVVIQLSSGVIVGLIPLTCIVKCEDLGSDSGLPEHSHVVLRDNIRFC